MTKRDRTADFCSQLEKIDACMRAVYGVSFQEFRKKLFDYAFEEGKKEGEREGRVAGRRAAKGLKETRKKRGRPPAIDPGFMMLMMYHHVDARRQEMTVDETI